MLLKVMTWNINFIHDNCHDRLLYINKVLTNAIKDNDIIALQESTIPFNYNDNIANRYYNSMINNIPCNIYNATLVDRSYWYKCISELFHHNNKNVIYIFDKLLNLILRFNSYIYSNYGNYIKYIYFKHLNIYMLLCIICPLIFVINWIYFGMSMLISNKIINKNIQKIYVDNKIIQICDFIHNNKPIRLVNIHLIPGKHNKIRRYQQIKKIIKLCNNHKNVILMGDFNSNYNSKIYKYLIKKQYKSSVYEHNGKEINTFPAINPINSIDYVMYRGNDIELIKTKVSNNYMASDHNYINVIFDIK